MEVRKKEGGGGVQLKKDKKGRIERLCIYGFFRVYSQEVGVLVPSFRYECGYWCLH